MRSTIQLTMRGISPDEFKDYFEEKGCVEKEEYIFHSQNWNVKMLSSYCNVGSIKLVEVELHFYGDEDILLEVVANLRKQFMRAGG